MKKVLFTFNVNHVVDLITNSSSELFVLKASTREIVKEMISNVYPDYLNEYNEVECLGDKSFSDLEAWLDNKLPYDMNYNTANSHLLDGLDFEEMFEISEWDKKHYNKEVWKLKSGFITEDVRQMILDQHDPNREIWFLYSLQDNPNWDMQQKLMEIGQRFHLG